MPSLLGPSVWPRITAAAKAAQQPSYAAAAYVGQTGHLILPLRAGSTLVADASLKTVKAGATSPAALLRILKRGVRIFSAQNLHAKVYAFDTVAFVGSANVSHSSSKHLIEAVIELDDPASVADVRAFVTGLAITELDEGALIELQKHYVPPPKVVFPTQQAPFTTLIMELTKEHGGKRASQVQPPKLVWEHYFGSAVAVVDSRAFRSASAFASIATTGAAPGRRSFVRCA